MLKKISLMVIALLMLSLGQAFAAAESAIYAGDEKKLVEDFNNTAKKLGFSNLKLQDFELIDKMDHGDLYAADLEGLGDMSGILILKSKTSGILRMSTVVESQDVAEKIFKTMFALLNIPEAPYKEGMDEVIFKTSTNQEIKVSVETYSDNKTKTYTLSFRS